MPFRHARLPIAPSPDLLITGRNCLHSSRSPQSTDQRNKPTMRRRMHRPENNLQSPAQSPLAVSADESERAQVVPAVSFRRSRLMPKKDRQRHLMMTAAVGANLLLFGMTTDAFASPFTRYCSYKIIGRENFHSSTFSSSSSSALFVASMPKKNADANPVFGREGGADSVGLQSGLGADVSRLDASEMTSILDDGSGHVNAELARSIWQWGKY